MPSEKSDQETVVDVERLEEQKTVYLRINRTQEWLAFAVTAMVAIVVGADMAIPFIAPDNSIAIENGDKAMHELFIVYGVILGFYFGSKK